MPGNFKTSTEKRLAEIWAEVIGISEVSRDEDFFDIGGDSLLATKVVLRARREWNFKATVRLLIDAPVLSEMAECVDLLAAGSPAGGPAGASPAVAV